MEAKKELLLFKAVVGEDKVIVNQHINVSNGNRVCDGYYNQGISKAKLIEFIKKENKSYEYWKNL